MECNRVKVIVTQMSVVIELDTYNNFCLQTSILAV